MAIIRFVLTWSIYAVFLAGVHWCVYDAAVAGGRADFQRKALQELPWLAVDTFQNDRKLGAPCNVKSN